MKTSGEPRSRWELGGRDRELATGFRALREQCGIMVLGDAGVGKTSFAASLVSRLVADHIGNNSETGELTRVVKLRATSALATVPLGALAPLLAPQAGVEVSKADMAIRAQQALTRQFRDRGALVVIDDIHHLDPLSADVIHAMVNAELPDAQGIYTDAKVRWLLLGRARQVLPPGLAELWSTDQLSLVQLHPLELADVRRLVDQHLGEQTQETLSEIMHATAGNPLLLHELIEGARSMGQLVETGFGYTLTAEAWTNPQVVVAVHAQLGELTDGQLGLLEFMAVAEPAPPALVVEAFPEADLAHLERRGLLAETNNGLVLSHGLYSRVLASEVSMRRRVALLDHVVTANLALMTTTTQRRDRLQLALTAWDLRANHALSPANYLSSTRLAIANNDAALARAFLEHVRDLSTDDRFEMQLAEAQVKAAEGDVADAVELLGSLLSSGGTDEQLHDAASALSTMIQEFQIAPITSIAMIEDARFLLDSPGLETRLLIIQAQALVLNGLLRAAGELVAKIDESIVGHDSTDEAVRAVHDDLGLEIVRLVLRANGGLWPEARVHANRVHGLDDGRSVTVAHRTSASDGLAGAFCLPQTAGVSTLGLTVTSGGPSALVFTALGRFLAGRRADAARFARRAELALEDFDPLGLAPVARLLINWIEASAAGRPHANHAVIDELRANDSASRWLQLLGAWREAEQSRAAGKAFDSASLVTIAERSFGDGWFAHGLTAVHQLARHGDAHGAVGQLLPVMQTLGRPITSAGITPAIVAHALGCAQQDPVRLIESGSTFWSFGWPSVAAESYLEAAHFFDVTGDQHNCLMAAFAGLEASTRSDSNAILTRPGVKPLVSMREFEVAKTIASGKSSKQTAEQLFVSPRTIDNQVFRLCKRFNLAGRDDLVSAVELARSQVTR